MGACQSSRGRRARRGARASPPLQCARFAPGRWPSGRSCRCGLSRCDLPLRRIAEARQPELLQEEQPDFDPGPALAASHTSPIHVILIHLVGYRKAHRTCHRLRRDRDRTRHARRPVDPGRRRWRPASLAHAVLDGELSRVALLHGRRHCLLLRVDALHHRGRRHTTLARRVDPTNASRRKQDSHRPSSSRFPLRRCRRSAATTSGVLVPRGADWRAIRPSVPS